MRIEERALDTGEGKNPPHDFTFLGLFEFSVSHLISSVSVEAREISCLPDEGPVPSGSFGFRKYVRKGSHPPR